MGGTPESVGRGGEVCDPLEDRCSALKQQIDQRQSSGYVFINTAENLRDTSFNKVRVARAGESFRIVGDAPNNWGLQYKEAEDEQGNRLYLCVNDGNNVSVEKDFEPSVEALFQNTGSGKRSIIYLQDNAPALSDFIDPRKYKNHSFTLQNARGQQVEVAYKNGDWRIVKDGEVTDDRALIWQGKNVVLNVQELKSPPNPLFTKEGELPPLVEGRGGEGFFSDSNEQQASPSEVGDSDGTDEESLPPKNEGSKEEQLTPEQQAMINAERLNWKNWSIDSVERKSSLTWCVKRSKTIVFEDGKTKELENEEYTGALDGKAQEWWESKNGKHEKVIQLSKDDIPLVRKQMELQEEPLIWGFDDLEYDDDSPMPRPRKREIPAHRNPTGQGW